MIDRERKRPLLPELSELLLGCHADARSRAKLACQHLPEAGPSTPCLVRVDVKILSSWVKVISPLMAANATFDLKAGVWFRRTRLPIVSSGSLGTALRQKFTYRPVQISGAGSDAEIRHPPVSGAPAM
jgi:hypothetical protein